MLSRFVIPGVKVKLQDDWRVSHGHPQAGVVIDRQSARTQLYVGVYTVRSSDRPVGQTDSRTAHICQSNQCAS